MSKGVLKQVQDDAFFFLGGCLGLGLG